jgi:exodeoxyribonuclease-5
MRQLLHPEHQSWIPVGGDKLVCLRNNHEVGLLNGAQWEAMGVLSANEDRVIMKVRSMDNDAMLDVEAHSHHMLGRTDAIPWWSRKEAEEFDYGYAMTVHKSQGSQWDDVVVFDESYCFRDDRHKWLYTAITRAAKQITVVKT